MNKRISISLFFTFVLLLLTVVTVLAGATSDIGTLGGLLIDHDSNPETPDIPDPSFISPPAGDANWTAWIIKFDLSGIIFPPSEIMTEDSLNPAAGPNNGYTDAGWDIQVENFESAAQGVYVDMSFGGLNTYSGKHWYWTFQWDSYDPGITDWGVVPLDSDLTNTAVCPTIYPVVSEGDAKLVSFFGEPETTYQIYRSQNTSGSNPPNGYSSGRYDHIGQILTDAGGLATYQDTTWDPTSPGPWYEIIYMDVANPFDGSHGCHSEPLDPLNVVMGDFTAVYDDEKSAVVLEWETVSETNIVGFNVFRDTDDTLVDSVKINTAIIPAKQPGSPVGDIYTFEDADIEDGQTYYYWIEILTNDMSDQTVGPESVTIPEAAWFYYFLPLLFN